MTKFVQYTEENDHEGETWHFWLQVDGNEEQLAKLRGLLAAESEDGELDLDYTLTENVEPESVVDKLVQYADMGYMRTHTKVLGSLTCPADLGEDGDELYKGRIADHFTTGGES